MVGEGKRCQPEPFLAWLLALLLFARSSPPVCGLVQPPPATRNHRGHPTYRKGGQLPSSTRTSPASWAQTKHSPTSLVRFSGLLPVLLGDCWQGCGCRRGCGSWLSPQLLRRWWLVGCSGLGVLTRRSRVSRGHYTRGRDTDAGIAGQDRARSAGRRAPGAHNYHPHRQERRLYYYGAGAVHAAGLAC